MRDRRWSARVMVGMLAAVVAGVGLLATACAGDETIEQPTPLFDEVPVEYPMGLWDRGVEGETVLNVRVTDEGVVDSVVVLETSGVTAFDSAALAGAVDLRFEPARKGGKEITVWARIPVRFRREADRP